LMVGLSGIVAFNRSDNYLESLPETYQAITIDDIHQATDTYIDPNIWTWIIVGDLSIIENEIRELEFRKNRNYKVGLKKSFSIYFIPEKTF